MTSYLAQQRHRIRTLFSRVEGNARVIVVTEGIAAISFQWQRTYFPLYMAALGVSELQIGLLGSVLIFTQVISTLLGGYVADRLGRKRTLVVFDILCWGVPMFLFAIARSPWYFLIGQFINGFVYVVMPSFQCLFVEDVPNADRPAVFGMLQFLTSGARLLVPVAGWAVAWWGLVPAGRAMAAICMTSSILIALVRQWTLDETQMGRTRMAETAGLDLRAMLGRYLRAVRSVVDDRQAAMFLVVRNLVAFDSVIWMTYATLYLTNAQGVGLAESQVSIFPFVSAAATMVMILVAAKRMQVTRVFDNLWIGQLLKMIAALFFVISPPGVLHWALLWAVINAISIALFQPATRTYWANVVGDRERALVFSASSALISLMTLPAGPLAGALYTTSPRSPFFLSLALEAVVLVLILTLRRNGRGATSDAPRP
jgi:MFS family permease